MTTTRPRVTARSEIESIEISQPCGDSQRTPRVLVEVTFDLHDHKAALAALDSAVADVRAQIEDTNQEDTNREDA